MQTYLAPIQIKRIIEDDEEKLKIVEDGELEIFLDDSI